MATFEQVIKNLQLFRSEKGVNAIINLLYELELGPINQTVIKTLKDVLIDMIDNDLNHHILRGINNSLYSAASDTLEVLAEFTLTHNDVYPKGDFIKTEEMYEVKGNDGRFRKVFPRHLIPPRVRFQLIPGLAVPYTEEWVSYNNDGSCRIIASPSSGQSNYKSARNLISPICKVSTPWSLSSDPIIFGYIKHAQYHIVNSKHISFIYIEQYKSGDFGFKLNSYNKDKMNLLNALNEITFDDVRVKKFSISDFEFKITGDAHAIQNHLINIIKIIKTLEGAQVFSAEIEKGILDVIPSEVPSVTPYKLQLAPMPKVQMDIKNNSNNPEDLSIQHILYRLQSETAKGPQSERKEMEYLKDQTEKSPEDTEKLQMVLYRKQSI